MNSFIPYFILICAVTISCKNQSDKEETPVDNNRNTLHDKHVHIMSPQLISLWKEMGIPFSRQDHFYSNIDTILKSNGAEKVSLISMAYVYSSSEFGGDTQNVDEKMRSENDYLAQAKLKYPNRIIAYYGIDPLNDNALSEIERCHTTLNLDGIKLHNNASQVYLTEPEHLIKVKTIFQYASDNRIPILMHFDNSHPKFGRTDVMILADSILTSLNYVNLQIAHFGTSGGFSERTKTILDSFIELFEKKHPITKHKITFDISAVCLDKEAEGIPLLTENDFTEVAYYCRKLGFSRIVFGTDYPLYRSVEYLDVLKKKLSLTDNEVAILLKEK